MAKVILPKVLYAPMMQDDVEEEDFSGYIVFNPKFYVWQLVRVPKAKRFNIEIVDDYDRRLKHRYEEAEIIDKWEQVINGVLYKVKTAYEERWVQEHEIICIHSKMKTE